jgi:hypothetical protein
MWQATNNGLQNHDGLQTETPKESSVVTHHEHNHRWVCYLYVQSQVWISKVFAKLKSFLKKITLFPKMIRPRYTN